MEKHSSSIQQTMLDIRKQLNQLKETLVDKSHQLKDDNIQAAHHYKMAATFIIDAIRAIKNAEKKKDEKERGKDGKKTC